MYCKNCGSDTGNSKYCPNCGAEQTTVPPVQPNPTSYQMYNSYNSAPPKPVADMTVGEWMITMLITFIPLVGFICLLVWALGSADYKPSRKNWAIATLLWSIILIVIYVVIIALIAAAGTKTGS